MFVSTDRFLKVRHGFPQWHSHFSIWLITSNVLFAVRSIYDSGSRRHPSTSWSSFWTMTESVDVPVCPSRISSPPPVQLFIRVKIGDGSSCCVSVHVIVDELSLINHQWPELDFHTTLVIKPHLYSYMFSGVYFTF